jgi:hypothetical protein
VNKKKQKNFILRDWAAALPPPAGPDVFWFFFSKKNRLLCWRFFALRIGQRHKIHFT